MIDRTAGARLPTVPMAVGAVLLAAATRASSFPVAVNRDTGQMLYGGMVVLRGGTPYSDAALNKGPATYLIFAVVRLIVGRSELAIRLALLAAAVCAALALGEYLGRFADVRAGTVAALLFAALSAIAIFEGEDPDLEQFAVAPMALALVFASRESLTGSALAGASTAIAGALSPVFLIPLVPAVLWTLWTVWGRRANGYFVAAGMAAALLAGIGIWLAGGGALTDMIRQVPGTAGGPETASLLSLGRLVAVPARGLWLVSLGGTAVAIADPRLRRPALVMLAWIVLSWGRVKFGDYFSHDPEYNHHYYPALIGLCGGLALGLTSIWARRPAAQATVLSVVAVIPLAVGLVIVPERDAWSLPVAIRGIGANPWNEAYPLASWVDRHTRSGQRIFVAGAEAEIYWLADRLAPTPFFDTYSLQAFRQYSALRMRDLYRRPPGAIVAMRFDPPDPQIAELIRALRYRLAYSGPPGWIWLHRD